MSAALKEIEHALLAADARLERHQGRFVVVGSPGRLTPEALSRIRTLVSALPTQERGASAGRSAHASEVPSWPTRALSAPRWMSTHPHLSACFTQAGLAELRALAANHESAFEVADLLPVPSDLERVQIDDPREWELWGEYPGSSLVGHVWEHRRTTWLSHSLRVPTWMLDRPEVARHALRRSEGAERASTPAPSAPDLLAPRHVAQVERYPRYRLKRTDPAARACCVCGARPAEGPLPWLWDCHGGDSRDHLLLTCGPSCRAARGIAERKPS